MDVVDFDKYIISRNIMPAKIDSCGVVCQQRQSVVHHAVATLLICIIQDFSPYKTIAVIFNIDKL